METSKEVKNRTREFLEQARPLACGLYGVNEAVAMKIAAAFLRHYADALDRSDRTDEFGTLIEEYRKVADELNPPNY